ncbi:hypothetical protein Bca52824_020324 [Brassica carinata]|uniref:Disease resistance protein winged helix domain-containing protein n=1 Tax=Brassica carinata TaxID=52824 RepID=A0A8X8B191_BRACI|nr:hypothetical protein Bca52824_020324 [Brassica carinata]
MKTNILSVLKFSYDSLRRESIKSCFLHCALFPEDYKIDTERLIEYWLSEGFLGEYPDTKRAINKGHDVLGTLINASLLSKVGTAVQEKSRCMTCCGRWPYGLHPISGDWKILIL